MAIKLAKYFQPSGGRVCSLLASETPPSKSK